MPEFEDLAACLQTEALPSSQSLGSTATATTDYCPSAILEAGALLAVQLAVISQDRAEEDQRQFQTIGTDRDPGPVPGQDEIADPAPERCAAGAGAGAGPEAARNSTTGIPLGSDGLDAPSLSTTGNHLPPPHLQVSNRLKRHAASYLSKLVALTSASGLPNDAMEPDTGTVSDNGVQEPATDEVCHPGHSVSPPLKRRRFEDKPVTAETHIQHQGNTIASACMREPVEIHPLLFSTEITPAVKQSSILALSPPVETVQVCHPIDLTPNTVDSISCFTRTPEVNATGAPEKTPFDWFHLPGEIRNLIYSISLHWPDTKELYRSYYTQNFEHLKSVQKYPESYPSQPRPPRPPYTPRLRAPTILLLCKRITSECLGILQSRTLVIDRLPPWQVGDARPLPITNFIPKTTFQAIRRLEIRIPLGLGSYGSGYVWSPIACNLFAMLREKNCFEHLRVVFVLHYNPGNGAWRASEQRHLERIDHALLKLETENRNLKWPCTLERVYWIIEGDRASRADISESGELHPSDKEVGPYPDDEIFPSSIFEFI